MRLSVLQPACPFWPSDQGGPVKSLTLFVPRGPQTVMVAVAWTDAMAEQGSDKIAYSLYFE